MATCVRRIRFALPVLGAVVSWACGGGQAPSLLQDDGVVQGVQDLLREDLEAWDLEAWAEGTEVASDVMEDEVSLDSAQECSIPPYAPYCPCSDNAECESGYCILSSGGRVCAQALREWRGVRR